MGRPPFVLVAPVRRVRLLQQRLGGLRDRERPLPQAATGAGGASGRRSGRVRKRCGGTGLNRPRRPRRAATLDYVATHEEILQALGRVIDPELRKPVTELGMVR